MSTWIGKPGDRLTLREAQTALADSARSAARPSWIWLAGFLYPSVLLFPAIGLRATLGGDPEQDVPSSLGTLLPFLFPPLMLLVVGLARLSAPRNWDECLARNGRVRLRDAWAAGRGMLWSTFGLWLCVLLLDLLVLGVCYAIFQGRAGDRTAWYAYVVGGPLLLFACIYVAVVSVLFQLALQSLAQNRRGVVSALQHGWKLAKNDPWATARAALLDCVLSLALSALIGVIIVYVVLTAILGVARALYWGRVYRALGGLTPEDGVPGLPAQPPLPA